MGIAKKILVIDDEKDFRDSIEELLSGNNYIVLSASHPNQGLLDVKTFRPDLILLDLNLPDMDGLEVCRRIRSSGVNTPIIILSARGSPNDRVLGLDLGADDYLPKPFGYDELMARVKSVFRRMEIVNNQSPRILKSKNLEVNLYNSEAKLKRKSLNLTTMEFEILALLMQNSGKTLTRAEVIDSIQGVEWDTVDRSIDVLVCRLRNKLRDNTKKPIYLKTIWGKGYRFVGEVEEV